MEITREVAQKVLDTVDAGLASGVGIPEPGKMCVEAAVCYAMGLPHGDQPTCVSRALRVFKIRLNDSAWSSDAARAKGMRRLADYAIRVVTPRALRIAASVHPSAEHRAKLEAAAVECEKTGAAAAAAAARAARDKQLALAAEDVVQILVGMNVPGVQWLDLAPLS